MDLLSLIGPLATSPLLYPLLAGLCSLDGVLPMIPSEAAVLATGVLTHTGTPSLALVVVATALGVFVGDHLAYGLSRSVLGPRLINRSRHVSRAVAAAHRQLGRRSALLIVTSRFLPGGRVTMNLACGTAHLPLSRFSLASAVAALCWAAYTAGLGYLGGAAFVENPLLGLAVGLSLSFAIGGIIELIRRRVSGARARRSGGQSSEPDDGEGGPLPLPVEHHRHQPVRTARRRPPRCAGSSIRPEAEGRILDQPTEDIPPPGNRYRALGIGMEKLLRARATKRRAANSLQSRLLKVPSVGSFLCVRKSSGNICSIFLGALPRAPRAPREKCMKKFRVANAALVSTGAVLLASTAVAVALPAGAAAAGCAVDYTVSSQWQGGFGAGVVITNLGDPLTSWTLAWSYSAGQTVTQAWNTALTQSGAAVTAKNVSYNGTIATNGTASFGFNGSSPGSNPAPTAFALNGVACTGGTTPTTGPTTPPTTPPTTGPVVTPDVTVNTATRYQTVDGFGAAVSIWGSAWSTAETQTLVGTGANQLGLSIVRTGVSPVSSEWATQVNALKTAKSYGSGVKILASPWTAPAAWKTNNSRVNGGKLKTDYYDDYANHLNSYVQYMRNQGVPIDVTSVQNEPDWHPDYDSMDWSGTELRTFVRDQGAKVQNTKLMVAEAVNLNYGYTDPTLNDASARNNIGYIGGHLYGTEDSGRLKAYPLADQNGKPVWMTEWNFHEADGSGSNIWGNPSNQAVWNETLDDIMRTVHKSMESNWSAYIWWYGKRYYSFIGDGESAYGTTAGAPLKRGFAFSQFSKYVRPGYQRVALSKSTKASPLEVTAYQGGGKITLVILNRSTSAVNNAVLQAPQNVTKAEHYLTSQNTNAAGQPTTINGGQVTVNVPARSISTVVFTL